MRSPARGAWTRLSCEESPKGTMGSSTLGKAVPLNTLLDACIQAFGERPVVSIHTHKRKGNRLWPTWLFPLSCDVPSLRRWQWGAAVQSASSYCASDAPLVCHVHRVGWEAAHYISFHVSPQLAQNNGRLAVKCSFLWSVYCALDCMGHAWMETIGCRRRPSWLLRRGLSKFHALQEKNPWRTYMCRVKHTRAKCPLETCASICPILRSFLPGLLGTVWAYTSVGPVPGAKSKRSRWREQENELTHSLAALIIMLMISVHWFPIKKTNGCILKSK